MEYKNISLFRCETTLFGSLKQTEGPVVFICYHEFVTALAEGILNIHPLPARQQIILKC
jgi:hypothetical protein